MQKNGAKDRTCRALAEHLVGNTFYHLLMKVYNTQKFDLPKNARCMLGERLADIACSPSMLDGIRGVENESGNSYTGCIAKEQYLLSR